MEGDSAAFFNSGLRNCNHEKNTRATQLLRAYIGDIGTTRDTKGVKDLEVVAAVLVTKL